jgi:predicted metal-dependent phosphoesterase TrpH
MLKTLDLHMHTHYSDGEDSPEEVVCWAKENGIREMAITDHDNIDGVLEAKQCACEMNIIFHTGIEFSTENDKGIEMHLLGYDIDIENPRLKAVCREIAAKRKNRNDKMLAKLNELCGIEEKDIVTRKGQSFIGRPMMARALVKKGFAKNFQDAFDSILERPEIKKIKKEKINVLEAIDVIKDAGGKAVLAHPGLIKSIGKRGSEEFYENFDKLLENLVNEGLDGLECVYRKHTDEEEKRFIDIADKYNLWITRGSD